jgi:hypothetical protein
MFFFLTIGTFLFPEFLFDSFSELFHIFVQLLLYILCCHL